MNDLMASLATIIGAIGGYDLVKYLLNRKNVKSVETSKAIMTQFDTLNKIIDALQTQLQEKEQRFAEQIDNIRKLNGEIMRINKELMDVTVENTLLKSERKIKLCEVQGCESRVPQSGY